jgi:hypothetical protein
VFQQNFDLFLKDIQKGVAYFDNKEILQDVTAEYIDIDARLKAKVLENRYLELWKKQQGHRNAGN